MTVTPCTGGTFSPTNVFVKTVLAVEAAVGNQRLRPERTGVRATVVRPPAGPEALAPRPPASPRPRLRACAVPEAFAACAAPKEGSHAIRHAQTPCRRR